MAREAAALVRATLREWWHDNTFRLAAALAFYTIFSLAPVLLISVSLGAMLFSEAAVTEQVLAQIERLVGPEGAVAAGDAIRAASAGSTLATLIGVATMLFGSTVVFAELQSALNQIWDVQTNPRGLAVWRVLRVRLRSFAIVLGVGFLLTVSLVINAALAGVEAYMKSWIPGIDGVWWTANTAASLVVLTVLFAMIYRYLPDVQLAWRDVALGALVTAVLLTVGKHLIGLYLGQVAVGSAYGAAGSFAVLLIWTYYAALICFLGAEFTHVYAKRRGARMPLEEHAERIGHKPDAAVREQPVRA